MDGDRLKLRRGFWVRWVIASAFGLLIGFSTYFILVVGLSAEKGFILKTLVSAVSGAILGATVGGTQMLVLRSEISGMNRWMISNLFGGVIGGIVTLPVAVAVGNTRGFNMAVFAGGIVLGLSLGIAQVIILRGQLFRSGWWVLVHAAGIPLGWALGRGLGERVYNLMVASVGESTAQVIALLITIILFFGGYGVITGGILVWLLNHNQ